MCAGSVFGSGAARVSAMTCATRTPRTFTFISDVLQIFKITRQLRDEVINNEQGTSVEVIARRRKEMLCWSFKRLLYHEQGTGRMTADADRMTGR